MYYEINLYLYERKMSSIFERLWWGISSRRILIYHMMIMMLRGVFLKPSTYINTNSHLRNIKRKIIEHIINSFDFLCDICMPLWSFFHSFSFIHVIVRMMMIISLTNTRTLYWTMMWKCWSWLGWKAISFSCYVYVSEMWRQYLINFMLSRMKLS